VIPDKPSPGNFRRRFLFFNVVTDRSVLYLPGVMKRNEAKKIRRRAILDAASGEFENRRYDEVKLDEIAARAGVGKGTLYLYFKSKEALFAALAADGSDEMAARIREIADSDGGFKDRIFRFGHEFSVFAEQRHGLMRLLHQASSEAVTKMVRPHHKKIMEAVYYLIETGMKEGALRTDVAKEDLHCLLMGPVFFRIQTAKMQKKTVNLEVILDCFWTAASAGKPR
jgi:AcrR family transcriptional regulator